MRRRARRCQSSSPGASGTARRCGSHRPHHTPNTPTSRPTTRTGSRRVPGFTRSTVAEGRGPSPTTRAEPARCVTNQALALPLDGWNGRSRVTFSRARQDHTREGARQGQGGDREGDTGRRRAGRGRRGIRCDDVRSLVRADQLHLREATGSRGRTSSRAPAGDRQRRAVRLLSSLERGTHLERR